VRLVPATSYHGAVDADVAVFYGFQENVRGVMRDFIAHGRHAVHIDLGYWCRRWNGSRYGYHRTSIDAHHPTAYFQNVKHPQDRADQLGIKLEAWKRGGSHILLCGMSEKAAGVVGLRFLEWERKAMKQIRAATNRAIWYRPKPCRNGLTSEIAGTRLATPRVTDTGVTDINDAMREAFAVVSHHSNAGIDAIVSGVPCFQVDGVAAPMGLADLSLIETPKEPSDEERRQWANDVAYTQFNLREMRDGTMWRHFKDEGLIT
jgi:hypothetical protein